MTTAASRQSSQAQEPFQYGTCKAALIGAGDPFKASVGENDYFDDGRVIAWRCLLIENGRIVAENRSFIVGVI